MQHQILANEEANFFLERKNDFGEVMPDEVFGEITSYLVLSELTLFSAISKRISEKIQKTEVDKQKKIHAFKMKFAEVKISRSDAFFASTVGAVFTTLGVTVAAAGFSIVSGGAAGAVSGMTAYVINRAIDHPWIAGVVGTVAGMGVSIMLDAAASKVVGCVFPGVGIPVNIFDGIPSPLGGAIVGVITSERGNKMIPLIMEPSRMVYSLIRSNVDFGFTTSAVGGAMVGMGMTISSGTAQTFVEKTGIIPRLNLFSQAVIGKKEKQAEIHREMKKNEKNSRDNVSNTS